MTVAIGERFDWIDHGGRHAGRRIGRQVRGQMLLSTTTSSLSLRNGGVQHPKGSTKPCHRAMGEMTREHQPRRDRP